MFCSLLAWCKWVNLTNVSLNFLSQVLRYVRASFKTDVIFKIRSSIPLHKTSCHIFQTYAWVAEENL